MLVCSLSSADHSVTTRCLATFAAARCRFRQEYCRKYFDSLSPDSGQSFELFQFAYAPATEEVVPVSTSEGATAAAVDAVAAAP